jgi:probable O-glycosylation ligase (exosortase A-associated)
MRDILLIAVFAFSILLAVRTPYIGILIFFWISFMNPHRYSWGFAYNLPLAMVAAAVTFAGIYMHFKELQFPKVRETFLFLLLWGFFTLTTQFALYPNDAQQMWQINNKIFLITFIAMLVITTKERLFYFVIAIIVFIGFIGIKGTIFGLSTGGQFRVWGPPDSFMEDNNGIGLAMLIVSPFCYFAKDLFKRRWQSCALLAVGLALAASTVLTYSRGALVGLVVVAFSIFLKSERKLPLALGFLLIFAIGFNFLPEQWFERMHSIQSHDEDRSAQMRINSWMMSYNLAKAHPLGGGFECFTLEQYDRHSPDPELGRQLSGGATTAHSIYFEILATQGFGGLAIYLTCLISILLSMRKLERNFMCMPGAEWIPTYSRAFAVSIIAFMASGAFLSRAFFDLLWAIFAGAVCFKAIVYSGNWIDAPAPVPQKLHLHHQPATT